MTNLGMYSATPGTQPPAPFPTSGHHHPTPPQHGRFNERLVHQIYFKIFTYPNNIQELWVMEIPVTGYPRTRDPEHFFYTMTGDWDWSQRTADYWRHFFGVPIRHGGNPLADYYPPDMEPAITQTPQPTIAALATELHDRLFSPPVSGMGSRPLAITSEILDNLTLDQLNAFTEALRILSTSRTEELWDVD